MRYKNCIISDIVICWYYDIFIFLSFNLPFNYICYDCVCESILYYFVKQDIFVNS